MPVTTYKDVHTELRDYREGIQISEVMTRLIPIGSEKGFLHKLSTASDQASFECVVFDDTNFIHVKAQWFANLQDMAQSSASIEIHPMINRRLISAAFFDHGMTQGVTKFRENIYRVRFEDGHVIDITSQNGFIQSNTVYESVMAHLMYG